MTQYRICKGWLNKKYTVQSRLDWWSIWKECFPQRFDTWEEAQGLLKSFEDADRIALSSSKDRSRRLVAHRIKRLINLRVNLENSCFSGFAKTAQLCELDQELERLHQVNRKLFEKACIR